MNIIQKVPEFEIIVDYDGGISEIYYDGRRLSEILPCIDQASFTVSCTEQPSFVQLRCIGDCKVRYKKRDE